MDAIWLTVAVMFLSSGIVFGSVCSDANRTTNLEGCLIQTQANLMDTGTFWFGTQYGTLCPNGVDGTLECSNRYPDKRDSMGSRVFPSAGQLVLNRIDRYLEVKFETPPGEYTGCGNTFTFNTTWTTSVDPTVREIVYPWHVRFMPDLKWNYTVGKLYTLVVYDVGYFSTNGIYINIQGNDIATANAIIPFRGPLITTNLQNPYLFMIFKQNGQVTLTEEWNNKLTTGYTVPEFVAAANLTGPVAVNWIVASGDAYAAETMFSRGFVATCPVFVSNEMNKKRRDFLPNPASLSVWVNVTFSPTDLKFDVCCKTYDVKAREFNLNPIGNGLVKTSETRSEAAPMIRLLKKGIFAQASNFTGKTYALLSVDPDVATAAAGSETKPLLHMMYVNIQNGDTSSGDVVRVWRGPGPPDNVPHDYYFLLYEQQSELNATEMLEYAGDACKNESHKFAYRCLYNINPMVSENNLTLVGASWMIAERDEYVIYRNLLSNPNDVENQCQGQPGYVKDCPTNAAPIAHSQSFAVMTLCSIAVGLLLLY